MLGRSLITNQKVVEAAEIKIYPTDRNFVSSNKSIIISLLQGKRFGTLCHYCTKIRGKVDSTISHIADVGKLRCSKL